MTILSRCQRFDFRRISIDEITARLRFIAAEEKVTIDDEALVIIAKKGDGSMRDAQSIFDQVRSFCGAEINGPDVLSVLNAVDQEQFFRVSTLIKEKNVRGGIEFVEELMQNGHDLREFVGGLAEHFRNILVAKSTGSTQLIETSEIYRKRYEAIAPESSEHDLLRLIKIAQDLEQSIRWVSQPRYKLEIALMQMIRMESSIRIEDLLSQLDNLKKKLDGTVNATAVNGAFRAADTSAPPSRPGAEVKVVGTVNAGTLRSATYVRSPQRYQPFDVSHAVSSLSSYGVREPGFEKPTLRVVESVPSSTPTLSSQELRSRWQEFIDGVTKAKIAIGTVLTESTLVECTQGIVQIGCPDDYHCSMLRRNKEFLSETLYTVLGVRMNVEPIVHSARTPVPPQSEAMPVPQKGSAPSNGNRTSQPGNPNEHPLLALMRKELGAEPVQ
jgi:DNA polymerase-3 subunit gamma/tau